MAINPSLLISTQDDDGQERRPATHALPFLFVVLHCDHPLAGSARYLLEEVDLVTFGRGPARAATRRREGDRRALAIQLPGSTVSGAHARLVRRRDGGDSWLLEDGPSRNGTFLNGERVTRAPLRDGDFIEVGPVILRYRAALTASPDAPADIDCAALSSPSRGFATLLPHLADQLSALARIARAPVTALLLGETGSGKELLARAVHELSGRAGPLVPVNCGGLPASLLESQLFGHLKGSFTGAARDEPGYIRSADRGTLFLDEVGDLPLPAQAALLRALQEREVVPVGGTRAVKVDLRVVSATHRPLERMVARGEFRGDLLARLSGYRHHLAPLRARIEDIGLLVGDLLRRSSIPAAADLRFSMAAGRRLLGRPWPLNIRELEQSLAVAAALATSGVVEPAHLPESALELPAPLSPMPPAERREGEELRRHLCALLERHHGKVSYVARDMGKARMQIHRWMQRFGIDPKDYRG